VLSVGEVCVLLEELLAFTTEGFLIADKNGIICYVNKTWMNMCVGDYLPVEDVIGVDVHEIKSVHNVSSVAEQVFETKKAHSKVYTPLEKQRGILASGKPIFDADGNMEYLIVRVNDISDIFHLRDQIDNFHRIKELYIEYMQANTKVELNPIQADPKMQKIYQKCLTVSVTDATVLLLGESGVGKEVVANFIHNHSHRKNKPFLSINCGAIPENLIESELFGYLPGTFTGANKEGKKGIFEAANTGTLFLDEIGEMSNEMQVMLLRVLETNSIRPIGSNSDINVDVRIVVATNRNLPQLAEEGKFRKDLFYRINIFTITIPPLRDRPNDIAALAEHFLNTFNQQYHYRSTKKEFSSDLLPLLQTYSWPGNVRELRNVIEQMVVLAEDDVITPDSFLPIVNYGDTNEPYSSIVSVKQIAKFNDLIDETERQLFEKVIKTRRSSREIAKLLNVSQTTVLRKLHKYNLNLEG
jgi:transcriptional regulator with PAS, ATPase and Fis domain